MQDTKKPRIAILGATLDSTNMGVCALAAGAVRCFAHAYPAAEIHFLHFAKSPSVQTLTIDGEQVRVPVIPMRFSKRLLLPNNIALLTVLALLARIVPSKTFRNWVISKNACLSEIDAIDLFASIAGGDSFSDIYGMERYFYVSLPQILVLLLGKKLVLLPQTYGPFRGGLAKSLTRFILKRADHVYSRDLQGLEEIKSLVGPRYPSSKFEFCYDVGFVLQPAVPARIGLAGLSSLDEHIGPLVGLNVSGLLFMGGYTRDNMFGLRADYRQFSRDAIELLIEKGATVLLVPHVFGQEGETDTAACEQLYAELKDKYPGRLGLVLGEYNQHEIKYVIGKCDLLIGARMHACIAAVSQCIPAVCVAYSDKFIGVMGAIGVDSIVADARKLDEQEMLKFIENSLDARAAIRERLARQMPEVKSRVMNLFVDPSDSARSAEMNDPAKSAPVAAGISSSR
ncbi:MAG: polysaccharide pyruvyl transferase family protein [Acidobacteriia bacterium]|nr:polysaccharide pyruvyl transferase family protein [Terriglobia bacterium]